MKKQVFIFIETTRDRKIVAASLEALSMGQELSRQAGIAVTAILLGHGLQEVAEELSQYELDEIVVVDHPLLEQYQSDLFTEALSPNSTISAGGEDEI